MVNRVLFSPIMISDDDFTYRKENRIAEVTVNIRQVIDDHSQKFFVCLLFGVYFTGPYQLFQLLNFFIQFLLRKAMTLIVVIKQFV